MSLSRRDRIRHDKRCKQLGRHHWRPITSTTLYDELTFSGGKSRRYLRTCERCGVREWVPDNRTSQ